MDLALIRLAKPIAFAILTFFSYYYLSGSLFISFVVSLVPLLLGLLGVLASFAYMVSALIFLAAVLWAVVPAETKTLVRRNVDVAMKEFTSGLPDATPPEQKPTQ